MAKTVINEISITELSDDNFTSSCKGTLCELLKIHLLDSKSTDKSLGLSVQIKLVAFTKAST